MPVYGCKSSCHSCPALHRRTGPLAPRDNHSLAAGHWFFHRLLLTEHCTDPVCALQTLIRIAATQRVYALLTMCCMGTALM